MGARLVSSNTALTKGIFYYFLMCALLIVELASSAYSANKCSRVQPAIKAALQQAEIKRSPEELILNSEFQEAIWALRQQGEIESSEKLEKMLIERLMNEEIVSSEPLQGATDPRLVTYKSGIQGVFKWNNREWTSYVNVKHELAAFELDRLLGLNIVPVTVSRKYGNRTGTVQFFMKGWVTGKSKKIAKAGKKINFFDYLIGNEDRDGRNFLVRGKNEAVAIDHGMAFQTDEIDISNVDVFGDIIPSQEVLNRLQALSDDEIKNSMKGLLSTKQIKALLSRKKSLIEELNRR